MPKCIQPTGPGGHGRRGSGRGHGRIPNQVLTSLETLKYIREADDRTEKKEQIKKEKELFWKKALAEKEEREDVEEEVTH